MGSQTGAITVLPKAKLTRRVYNVWLTRQLVEKVWCLHRRNANERCVFSTVGHWLSAGRGTLVGSGGEVGVRVLNEWMSRSRNGTDDASRNLPTVEQSLPLNVRCNTICGTYVYASSISLLQWLTVCFICNSVVIRSGIRYYGTTWKWTGRRRRRMHSSLAPSFLISPSLHSVVLKILWKVLQVRASRAVSGSDHLI